jgi:hypothetical protein
MSDRMCRCCGVPVGGHPFRVKVGVCIDCDSCDRLHGAQLQGVLAKAVIDGKLPVWSAIARAMFDDAQLTNRLVRLTDGETADAKIVNVIVVDPPARWLVLAARLICRGQQPDMQTLVDEATRRWLPCRADSPNLRHMERDVLAAVRFIDPEIMDVKITTKRDPEDLGHLVIELSAKTSTLGVSMPHAEHVDIPDDIMSRKRAEA